MLMYMLNLYINIEVDRVEFKGIQRNPGKFQCRFVGSWVALGFVWVSFPRATSVGFSFSRLIAGVETRFPRRSAEASGQASAQ